MTQHEPTREQLAILETLDDVWEPFSHVAMRARLSNKRAAEVLRGMVRRKWVQSRSWRVTGYSRELRETDYAMTELGESVLASTYHNTKNQSGESE